MGLGGSSWSSPEFLEFLLFLEFLSVTTAIVYSLCLNVNTLWSWGCVSLLWKQSGTVRRPATAILWSSTDLTHTLVMGR